MMGVSNFWLFNPPTRKATEGLALQSLKLRKGLKDSCKICEVKKGILPIEALAKFGSLTSEEKILYVPPNRAVYTGFKNVLKSIR
jgi:hypothetical protein